MTQQQFDDPPELFDSSGERIVQFRKPDGTLFSNHPEHAYALAIHNQNAAKAAETAVAAVDTKTDAEVEDDVVEQPDDGDGTTSYEEMTSHDLAELVKSRDLKGLPDRKRSTIIKALQDWDAANSEA